MILWVGMTPTEYFREARRLLVQKSTPKPRPRRGRRRKEVAVGPPAFAQVVVAEPVVGPPVEPLRIQIGSNIRLSVPHGVDVKWLGELLRAAQVD